jgi:hypothetical protein
MGYYTKEELEEINKRIDDQSEKDRIEADRYWKEEYPHLSFEDRRNVWLRHIWHHLRHQGESGGNEFVIFDKISVDTYQLKEPEIDAMMDFIIDEIVKVYCEDEAFAKALKKRTKE